MSYDIWLEIDTGADEPWRFCNHLNYTSNCAPMWRAAGADLQAFDRAPCTEAAGPLAAAAKRMEDAPHTYRAMNPPNGWGDYESCLNFLREIAELCGKHPKATLRVGC